MAITRANVESLLVRRVGTLFTALSLDGVTANGTNADLNDPIIYALQVLGYSASDMTDVADSDLLGVSTDDYRALLDYAELRALESAYSAAVSLVDTTVGPRSEQLGQMAGTLERRIEAKRKQVANDYGDLGVGTLQAGVITLDFAEVEVS